MTFLDLHANSLHSLQREIAVWNDIQTWLIHDNPIQCNCSVAWLRDQLRFINNSRPAVLCAAPPSLEGRPLANTDLSDLSCGLGPATQGLVIGTVVVIALAIVIGAVVVILYRNRRPLSREMFKRSDWTNRSTEWNGRNGSCASRDLRGAYPHDYPEYIVAPHKPVPVTEL